MTFHFVLAASLLVPAPTSDVLTTAEYITTRDGTRIAVDVHLPSARQPGQKLPAVLELTRYWRASEDPTTGTRHPSLGTLDRLFLRNGYAVLKVDARGSGASFGTRPYGMATTFIEEWGQLVGAMDRNDRAVMRGAVRRVDADSSGALVAAAVRDHAQNPDVAAWARQSEYHDDRLRGGPSYADLGPTRWRAEIQRSNVPMLVLVSWLDAGTAEGVRDRFRNFRNPQKLVIMASAHGGGTHANPFLVADTPVAGNPTQNEMAQMRLQFFDRYLKGTRNGVESWPAIRYYTLGAEAYRESSTWPLAGSTTTRFYLDGEGILDTLPAVDRGGR